MTKHSERKLAKERKRKERETKKLMGIVYVQVIAFKDDAEKIKEFAKRLFNNASGIR